MDKFTLEEMQNWNAPCSKDAYSKFIKWAIESGKTELGVKDLLESSAVSSLRDITYFTLNKPSIVTGSFKAPCIFILEDVCKSFPHPSLISFTSVFKANKSHVFLLKEMYQLKTLLDIDRQRIFIYIDYMIDGNFSFDVLAELSYSANSFFKENKDNDYKKMVLNYLNVNN